MPSITELFSDLSRAPDARSGTQGHDWQAPHLPSVHCLCYILTS